MSNEGSVDWRKMFNLKVASYVLFEGLLRTIAWDIPEFLLKCQKRKKNVVEHQRITANHSRRHLNLILVLLHMWEDVRVWNHWNYSLNMHFNYLYPHTFSLSSIPSQHIVGDGCIGWWLDVGQHFSFTERKSNIFLFSVEIKHI